MGVRFVPFKYEKETLLKLLRLQQGSMCVNDYAKLMESLLLKVGLPFEIEEEKVARFVSGLRRDMQDVVELYGSSSFEMVLHLAIKEHEAKRIEWYNDYYSSSLKGKEKKHDK